MHGASEIFEAVCGEAEQVSARRLLLADSDPIFLHGLAAILGAGFPIVGEVTIGTELLESLQGTDVLISGFSLACGRYVLGLLRDIRVRQPDLAVIILLSPTASQMVSRLHAACAKGVISRRTAPQDLRQLVLDALQGRPTPPLMSRSAGPDSTASSVDLSALTSREIENFRLIGLGKSSREMGALLGISDKTISSHRESIKSKLQLRCGETLCLVASAHAIWEATGADHCVKIGSRPY